MSLFALAISGTMAFAQDTTKLVKKEMMKTKMEMKSDSVKSDSVYYTCTMHPEVRLDKPGKCPQCGMDLVKKTVKSETGAKNSQALVTYTCTMHPEVTSDKPGKCPKCGMDLVVKK